MSQLAGATAFIDTMIDNLRSFRLEANGKRLFDNDSDLRNRTWVRRLYHPDAQPRDPIYTKSFSAAPEDTKNTTSFANAANLGVLELVLTIPDYPVNQGRVVDVMCHSYNIIQSRRGDAVKSLK
jgi:hypothetical protein